MRAVERLGHGGHGALILESPEHQGPRGFGPRQHLESDLGQHGERAIGTGHELREVIACDILDDAPTSLECLTPAADGMKSEQVIARRTLLDTPRSREIAGEHAAQSLAPGWSAEQGAPIAGLESEHLLGAREHALDLQERRSRPRREYEFLR